MPITATRTMKVVQVARKGAFEHAEKEIPEPGPGHGYGQLAAKAHVNREHLFRMLSKRGNPELHSLRQVVGALGFKLVLQRA